ncbi:MAG: hypothetical protein IT287_00095 [Bdellovibrionaceae bacterium]|nr:hypothetical protein [Pseudobdellovibrionaceae bacterium]
MSLDICKNRCEQLSYDFRVTANLESAFQQSCISKLDALSTVDSATTASAASACSGAVQSLAACKGGCKSLYDTCLTSCRGLPTPMERTEAFRKCDANYKNKPTEAPSDTDKEAVPLSPEKDAEETPTPEDTPVVSDNTNTGDPNVASQLPALDGLGNTPTIDPDIGGTDASAINFASGPTADKDAYARAASGVPNTADFTGNVARDRVNDDPSMFAESEIKSSKVSGDSEAKSGQGAQGGGPPIAPGSNGSPGQNTAGNAKNKGGAPGGGYRNAAGEYLSRHSPFSFQSGGASNLPGSKNGGRTVANKKNPGPAKYSKKENDGKEALHRLFGNGLAPASYRRNPYGAGSGRTCMDTVFCTMETFYNKIERYPNHEINPDSY